MKSLDRSNELNFIDLFSGCGGLSLGLSQAGWSGMFAVERAVDAFKTFKANFLDGTPELPFDWPAWLPQTEHSIDDVLDKHFGKLRSLAGKVDLVAGGPPCQGFSFAGKRNGADPRNRLFERYVQFVKLVEPKALVLENVPGMRVAHATHKRSKREEPRSYYERLIQALDSIGYEAEGVLLDASRFGVPQRRSRLVVIGLRRDVATSVPGGLKGILARLTAWAAPAVSVGDAISDLAVGRSPTVECRDEVSRAGFRQVRYRRPTTSYQIKMNAGVLPEDMDSMRLANHRPEVVEKFELIRKNCQPGVTLRLAHREEFGMLKHRTVLLDRKKPAPTLTTLPDDILHYQDPRILTVRESARLQSFPDWFVFRGKYTTGGMRRRVECPRYTQVGNAVPPLMAEAIGAVIREALQQTRLATRGAVRKLDEAVAA